MQSCIHACMHACIHSFIHSFIHSCIHAFMHSFIHSFIHSFMHSCIHAFTHCSQEQALRRLCQSDSIRLVCWLYTATGSSLYCSWCSARGSSISFCRTSSCSHHHTLNITESALNVRAPQQRSEILRLLFLLQKRCKPCCTHTA